MQYYQSYDSGLIYTEDEAKRYANEQITKDDLAEMMACHYSIIDLFHLIPEDMQAQILDETIDFKIHEIFTTHIEDDDLMFAHDCPGHEV